MRRKLIAAAAGLLAATSLTADVRIETDTVIDELKLVSNTNFTVISTATLTIRKLTGGNFNIWLSGYGRMVVCDIQNAEASIIVESSATLEFKRMHKDSPEYPSVCSDAFYHVDADAVDSIVTETSGDMTLVSRWNDVRGAGHPYSEKNPSDYCKHKPFVNQFYLNGRDVIDFGTIFNGDINTSLGWGGSLLWSETCVRPVEVYMVAGDNEFAKNCVTGTGGAQHRNNTFFGCTTSATAYRGNGTMSNACQIVNSGAVLYTATSPEFSLDGAIVNPTQCVPEDGMHVIGYRATKATFIDGTDGKTAPINAFASERNYECGGIRIAEYMTFTNVLTAAQRTEVYEYLTNKWFSAAPEFRFKKLSAEAGGKIMVGPGITAVPDMFNDGGATISGNGTLAASETELASLKLTEDKVLTVADGQTVRIQDGVTGGAYRLSKTGEGPLAIDNLSSPRVRVTVEEGALKIGSSSTDGLSGILAGAVFHVDAAAADSLVLEERDGVKYVKRWNDVRGEGYPYADRSGNIGKHDPFLSENWINGYPVVDFGTTWNSGKTDGWGAALRWSEGIDRPMDIFVVEQHNEDMIPVVTDAAAQGLTGPLVRNQALIGADSDVSPDNLSFVPNNPASGYDSCGIIFTSARVGRGGGGFSFSIDGATEISCYAAEDYHPGYGLHVYSAHVGWEAYATNDTTKILLNAFGCERGNIYGGQRIAECIIFTNLLTVAERATVNAYLNGKWRGGQVGEITLRPNGTLQLSEQGVLRAKLFFDEGGTVVGGRIMADATISADSISVVGGDAVYDPLLAADAWFHVDASQTNLFATLPDNPNEVYCWSDVRSVRAADQYTRPDYGHHAWNGEADAYPFVNHGYLNGLPVLDFGPIWTEGVDTDNTLKRWMRWDVMCETPYTFLIVVGDNELAKTRTMDDGNIWTKRMQAFIGNSLECKQADADHARWPIFGRDVRENNSVNSPYVLASSDGSSSLFYQDGSETPVASPKTTPFQDGMHLLAIEPPEAKVAAGNQHCDAFGSERTHVLGGQRIAECLVFTEKLPVSERRTLERLMLAKWFGSNGVERVYANVTVSAGASFSMPYQRLIVTETFSIGGVLKAQAVTAAPTVEITSTAAAVEGELVLPATGMITIGGDSWNVGLTPVKVLGASSVSGSVKGWTVSAPGVKGHPVLSTGTDGVYATFMPNGTIIIFK